MFAVHPVIFYIFLSFFLILAAFSTWLMIIIHNYNKSDKVIFIDKSNRWSMLHENVKDKPTFKNKEKEYALVEDCALLNKKGKALYIFSENKATPLKLNYNNAKWVDSESLMAIINNKLIQKLVQPSDQFKDTLILFGAIGGMIAGLSSILILLKQFGILK